MSQPFYKLRFCFDYHCGGSLWSYNDAALEKFGVGILDAATYDLNGKIIQEANAAPMSITTAAATCSQRRFCCNGITVVLGAKAWLRNCTNWFQALSSSILLEAAARLLCCHSHSNCPNCRALSGWAAIQVCTDARSSSLHSPSRKRISRSSVIWWAFCFSGTGFC